MLVVSGRSSKRTDSPADGEPRAPSKASASAAPGPWRAHTSQTYTARQSQQSVRTPRASGSAGSWQCGLMSECLFIVREFRPRPRALLLFFGRVSLGHTPQDRSGTDTLSSRNEGISTARRRLLRELVIIRQRGIARIVKHIDVLPSLLRLGPVRQTHLQGAVCHLPRISELLVQPTASCEKAVVVHSKHRHQQETYSSCKAGLTISRWEISVAPLASLSSRMRRWWLWGSNCASLHLCSKTQRLWCGDVSSAMFV